MNEIMMRTMISVTIIRHTSLKPLKCPLKHTDC